jgi:proline racemase
MALPRGSTMHDKQAWALRHADRVRRLVVLEPRGHQDLSAAVLTEPVAPGSHAGLLFMRQDGYVPMSAHGVIAAVTIALERGLIDPGGDGRHVTFDTVAGTIRADAEVVRDESAGTAIVQRASLTNVPSFVMRPGVELVLASRRLRADIAFGGRFYAIVDSESAGLALDRARVADLRGAGVAIAAAAEGAGVVHPGDARIAGVHGTVFTSPPHDAGSDLRTVTVLADGSVDRSAGGTGMSAVMAVLDAMGLLSDAPFVSESITGTTLRAWGGGRTMVGEHEAIVPVVEGRAWITGEHVLHAAVDDPLRVGFYWVS